jgi:hypothetical protein
MLLGCWFGLMVISKDEIVFFDSIECVGMLAERVKSGLQSTYLC